MTGTPRLDIEDLHHHLRDALRHGARASRLLRYTPAIIELLCPAADHPDLNEYDRAIAAESLIRHAIDAIGGNPGHAIATVLCLPPGTLGRTLEDRRRIAAGYLDIEADTFRRYPHEKTLLFDLAIEIYRHHTTNHAGIAPTIDSNTATTFQS